MLEVIIKDHNENSSWKFRHFLWKILELSWSLTWFSIWKLMAKLERSMGY
jgi:hypothetical protein